MPIDLYPRVVRCIGKPVENRSIGELHSLEDWFRMKSNLFAALPKETLLDVIQHCDFISYQQNDCIIHQGEKGHRFYIILRGQVSVLHKDAFEDVDLGDEGTPKKVDRTTLGNCLVVLGEGATFGEIALINPDCIRTASVVADERTDLVVIHRDLYNRSVSKVVAKLFQEKVDFVESLYMFSDWSQKWKKAMAVSLKKETISFDSPLIKQGDPADKLFFILSGEVKMTVDPEAHYRQFDRYMHRCEVLEDHDDDIEREKAYFPQKFLPQLYKCSRINRVAEIARPSTAGQAMQLPKSWSPSAIRKMNQQINAKKIHLNLCFLGSKQCVGDVEFVLNLTHYHTSAMCTQETTVMVLAKVHFERLFKRRNPRTVKQLARVLELQLVRRSLKPNIILSVPLLKCFIYRLQEVSGERKPGEETPFSVPDFIFRVPKSHTGSRLVTPSIGRHLLSAHGSATNDAETAESRQPPFVALSSLTPTDRPHSAAVVGEFHANFVKGLLRSTTSAT